MESAEPLSPPPSDPPSKIALDSESLEKVDDIVDSLNDLLQHSKPLQRHEGETDAVPETSEPAHPPTDVTAIALQAEEPTAVLAVDESDERASLSASGVATPSESDAAVPYAAEPAVTEGEQDAEELVTNDSAATIEIEPTNVFTAEPMSADDDAPAILEPTDILKEVATNDAPAVVDVTETVEERIVDIVTVEMPAAQEAADAAEEQVVDDTRSTHSEAPAVVEPSDGESAAVAVTSPTSTVATSPSASSTPTDKPWITSGYVTFGWALPGGRAPARHALMAGYAFERRLPDGAVNDPAAAVEASTASVGEADGAVVVESEGVQDVVGTDVVKNVVREECGEHWDDSFECGGWAGPALRE
ncbi:hypothetical protein HK101_003070, partial [Irineochytrium annulatum]